ncbi:SLBB domain-containing protein [Pseudomonadota bacterium]|nr:SLBB domain-containing protein [Pseudomonadota bacterium]
MRSLHLFIAVTLMIGSIKAQSIDPEFLSSLPDNMRDDFLSQVDPSSQAGPYQNVPSPDTRIRNLEDELLAAQSSLDRIRYEIEGDKSSASNEFADINRLERFGKNFFSSFQSSFIPVNQSRFDSTYVLDSGDFLSIQIVGQRKDIKKIKIERDGTINIENIGKISVGGLPFLEASELINQMIGEAFLNVKSYVTLSEVRDINVLAVGNVSQPGMYTLAGGSSPLSLLMAAGGINEHGSYRTIQHKRNNITLQTIDLYDVMARGNTKLKNSLQSGDVIVAPPATNQIFISGEVAMPAIYENMEGEPISELISIAGISSTNFITKIEARRIIDSNVEIISLNTDSIKGFAPRNGDAYMIFGSKPISKIAKTITISGEVEIPGQYTVADSTKLSDIINMAGGYSQNAYPEGGLFLRERVKQIEQEIKDKSYNQLIRFLVASPSFSQTTSPEGLLSFLSILKDYSPTGRVVTEFDLSEIIKNREKNRVLEHGDRIHIPSFAKEVYVFGEAMNPGAFEFFDYKDTKSYINDAGGFSAVADPSRVIIIQPNGDSVILATSLFSLRSSDLLPGSVIYVPRKIGKLQGINLATAVAPIISSFALSIASLNAIK